MTSKKTNSTRKIGVYFLLVFSLIFTLGLIDYTIKIELKQVSLNKFISESTKIKKTITLNKYERKLKKLSSHISDTLNYNKTAQNSYTKKPNTLQAVYTENGIERVLLIGDSQLEGLRSPVSAYCEKNNHTLVATIIWYGSSTKTWALTDTLQYFLETYKPTVVLFAIGLNELFVRDLESREAYIKTIMKIFETNGIRYSWIGPAAWTKDKGIIDVMKKNVGENFFSSHEIIMERCNDGRHPSHKAAKLWFDNVAETITADGIINFSTKVESLPKIKFSRTIILSIKSAK